MRWNSSSETWLITLSWIESLLLTQKQLHENGRKNMILFEKKFADTLIYSFPRCVLDKLLGVLDTEFQVSINIIRFVLMDLINFYIEIVSGNGMVTSSNKKLLTEPMLTKICVVMWHHNEKKWCKVLVWNSHACYMTTIFISYWGYKVLHMLTFTPWKPIIIMA